MRTLRFLATAAAAASIAFSAQVPESERGVFGRYRPTPLPPTTMRDSPRIETLTRAGTIYLALRDAIALAIENNLDVELQRLGPLAAEADLLRARGGGSVRGVQTNVTQGPAGVGGSSGIAQQGITGTGGTQLQPDPSSNLTAGGNQGNAQTGASGGPPVPSLDPTLVASFGRSYSNRPQTNTFITGTNALTSRSWLGDVRLQQGFLFGGVASAGIDMTRQYTNNLRADINPATTGGLAFSYIQPLLQGFGLAVNNRFIRIARNNRQVSDLVFEQQLVNTVFTVTRLYWDLVSLYEGVRVQRQSLELAERLLAENRQQEEAGTLAPIEVVRTRALVASARRDLTTAETRLRQQENVLKDYLTRGTLSAAYLAPVRVVPTDRADLPQSEAVRPLQDLIEEARSNRPELRQVGIQVENSRIALTGSRNALLPSLDLVAQGTSNTLFGSVSALPPAVGTNIVRNPDPEFVGGVGSGLSQVFGLRFPDYTVQLQLSIPILNRIARADYARDQITVRQQEIRSRQLDKQVALEVLNALTAVEQSRAAVEAAEEARAFQEQSLEAEREKFNVGVSTNYLIIQYQRDLAQALSAEISARADYAQARAALERSTGTLLRRYNIAVDQAYRGVVQ